MYLVEKIALRVWQEQYAYQFLRLRRSFAWSELASDPEGFEIREGAAAGEMAEVASVFFRPMEHLCEGRNGFELHGGAGATAVESVIVRVDRHGKRVCGARDGVGGLSIWPA
jgi:hypothetical protein